MKGLRCDRVPCPSRRGRRPVGAASRDMEPLARWARRCAATDLQRWVVTLALPCALTLALGALGCRPSKPVGPTPGGPATDAGPRGPGSVISGLLLLPGAGPAAAAVRVANPHAEPFDLADCSLTDELGARSRSLRARGARGRRDLVFPSGGEATRLAPGQEVWVARDAVAFRLEFGALPDFEVGEDPKFPDNLPEVPDVTYVGPASKGGAWLKLPPKGAAVLALMGPEGGGAGPVAYDVVPYNLHGAKRATADEPDPKRLRRYEEERGLARGSVWKGPPLLGSRNIYLPSPPFSMRGRILARDRDGAGRLLPDTDRYADWDGASSYTGLGDDALHRAWFAGQSAFSPVVHQEEAEVTVAASPESNYRLVVDAFDGAQHSIRVSIYYFKQVEIADALVRAIERGVDVTVYMEGGVVGVKHGFEDQERLVARMVEEAGRERSGVESRGLGRAYWLRSDPSAGVEDRYSFDHSKYVIIDDRAIIVGSENYGSTGHSLDNSQGNRGWEIMLATPPDRPQLGVVRDLLAVWNDDLDPADHHDIIRYTDAADTLDDKGRGRYGPPPRDFLAHKGARYGRYVALQPASEQFRESIQAQLVLSPDNSLAEQGSILGAIAEAKHSLLIQHLSMTTYWGSKRKGSARRTPNLVVEAVLAAARRGVRVRMLLNCRDFGCDRLDARWESSRADNDDTYELLNRIASKEGLDLEVRLLDMTSDDWLDDREDQGTVKIHNKGMVVDSEWTLISSINGGENSFKGNREVAVLLRSARVARYYERLFWYDWTTVAEPMDLEVVDGVSPATATSLHSDPMKTGIVLEGLTPGAPYYVRVGAVDDDDTDVEHTEPPKPLGVHESALSDEVEGVASAKGTLALRWLRNTSECLEGDLAGYRVYYGPQSVSGTLTPPQVRKAGLYAGSGATQGASPITVDPNSDRAQCKPLLERQVSREPKILPACEQLLQRVEKCYGQASEVFPELATALRRTGPPGTARWRRSMDALGRACTLPPSASAQYWKAERRECVAEQRCEGLFGCLRRLEQRRHRQILESDDDGKRGGRKGRGRGRKGRRRGRRKGGRRRSKPASPSPTESE